MKKLTLLIFLLSSVVACGGAKKVEDNSSPEALGKTILSAITHNDQELFAKYVPADEQKIRDFYQLYLKTNKLDTYQEEALQKMVERRPNTLASVKEVHQKFREGGLNDWSDVEFINVKYESQNKGANAITGLRVNFNNGDFTGTIHIGEAVEMENGWMITTRLRFEYYGPNFSVR